MISENQAGEMLDAYRRRYPDTLIMAVCGYNPHLLLSDQRSEFAKSLERYMTDVPEFVVSGGSVIPHLIPGEKLVMREIPYVDSPRRETVKVVAIVTARLQAYRESLDAAAGAVARFDAALRSFYDVPLGETWQPGYHWLGGIPDTVRRRLAVLIRSADRRQRKRGKRILRSWRGK